MLPMLAPLPRCGGCCRWRHRGPVMCLRSSCPCRWLVVPSWLFLSVHRRCGLGVGGSPPPPCAASLLQGVTKGHWWYLPPPEHGRRQGTQRPDGEASCFDSKCPADRCCRGACPPNICCGGACLLCGWQLKSGWQMLAVQTTAVLVGGCKRLCVGGGGGFLLGPLESVTRNEQ